MKETTQTLGEGIELVSVCNPNARSTSLNILLLLPAVPEKYAVYDRITGLLSTGCRKYPSLAALAKKEDALYGASLSSSFGLAGDVLQVSLIGSVIADRFALEGEHLSEELTDLMLDCLLDPNVRDGAFDEEAFRIQQREQLAAIDAEINDKRGYAIQKARQAACEGEPYASPMHGTRAEAESMTAAAAYEAYQEMLRKAVFRIYYVSPTEAPWLAGKLTEALSALEGREPAVTRAFHTPSPIRETCREICEPMPVTQSKLVMVFKYADLPIETVQLLHALVGGSPSSLLFANVREKLHLCYYCVSHPVYSKNLFFVDSGVSAANAQRTREAILAQIDAVCRGEFSDEMLENARKPIIDYLYSIGDTNHSIMQELHDRYKWDDPATPEERIERIRAVTRDEIIAAAKALRLDTVYLMEEQA